ncbi:hypothetical protein LD85_1062 [Saccharolobus islandicus L.D.8.5]|uniref:HEPN domain-containing protein n=1 Tax=Saccharolobus islandicus (strain L.D.8.5 / Lassen \|nr:HEPN domain-containing protein [Sulfolobus islandicus]ADB86747.1 hypothetical protein LD85_1062 [Sulfolobus islandicus L.D.8.5]
MKIKKGDDYILYLKMGRKDIVDLFKDRAVRFLREAISDLDKGWYDFAVFHAEQSLQLALKAILLENKGIILLLMI